MGEFIHNRGSGAEVFRLDCGDAFISYSCCYTKELWPISFIVKRLSSICQIFAIFDSKASISRHDKAFLKFHK